MATPTKPPVTIATAVVNTATAAPPALVTQPPVQYPQQQQTGYTPYQPYSQCNTCHLYSSPYCYTYCDESCCKHSKNAKDLHEIVADMQENLKKFQAIVNLGRSSDLPGFEETDIEGNDVPAVFGKKAKLAVKTLKRNIEKLEAKIKRGERHFEDENSPEKESTFESINHVNEENNILPYFDDELTDIADDYDVEKLALDMKKPTAKVEANGDHDYPHMRVHPDDEKDIDSENNFNFENDNNYEEDSESHHISAHPDEEKGIDSRNDFNFENDNKEDLGSPHIRVHPGDEKDIDSGNNFNFENDNEEDSESPHISAHPDEEKGIDSRNYFNFESDNKKDLGSPHIRVHPGDEKDIDSRNDFNFESNNKHL
jgi:hypothetical protein